MLLTGTKCLHHFSTGLCYNPVLKWLWGFCRRSQSLQCAANQTRAECIALHRLMGPRTTQGYRSTNLTNQCHSRSAWRAWWFAFKQVVDSMHPSDERATHLISSVWRDRVSWRGLDPSRLLQSGPISLILNQFFWNRDRLINRKWWWW